VDIDLPKLLLRIRAGYGVNQDRKKAKSNAPGILKIGLWFFTLAASSSKIFTVAQKLAGFFGSLSTLISKGDPWIHLPVFSGWGYSKDFPRPASKPFRSRYTHQINQRDNREEIASLGTAPVTSLSIPERTSPGRDDIVIKFTEEVEALGAKYYSCSQESVLEKILELLREHGIQEILAWDDTYLPDGLVEQLRNVGIQIVYPRSDNILSSSQIKAGLTGSSAAVAETGSLLLLEAPGQPLTASLLPEIHIALVWKKDIYLSLNQVIEMEAVKLSPAAVLITGPSRTADIEMTLTIGVHGPGELHIICME
jgi:L-lactate dehydrogenase complex protein LldG